MYLLSGPGRVILSGPECFNIRSQMPKEEFSEHGAVYVVGCYKDWIYFSMLPVFSKIQKKQKIV